MGKGRLLLVLRDLVVHVTPCVLNIEKALPKAIILGDCDGAGQTQYQYP